MKGILQLFPGQSEENQEVSVLEAEEFSTEKFIAAVDEFETPLLRYVGSLIGARRAEVEDIVQEAFIKLHKQWSEKGMESVQNTKAWLFRVSHNLCMDLGRKKSLHQKVHQDMQVENSENESLERDLLESKIRREAGELAIAELQALPDIEKEIILLKTVQDLKLREIAEVLDLKISQVNYKLNQGLAALTRKLKDKGVM